MIKGENMCGEKEDELEIQRCKKLYCLSYSDNQSYKSFYVGKVMLTGNRYLVRFDLLG